MASDDEPGCTLLPPPAISTCYCTRRAGCQQADDDDRCPYCDSKTCEGDCDEADNDAAWSEPAEAWVETVTALTEQGLL